MNSNLGNQKFLKQAKKKLFKIGQKWAIILRKAIGGRRQNRMRVNHTS